MPNRIIKESICSSDSIAQLTDFQEAFFYRLIVNCDDYGRMDGRPAILKARLYPLRERLTLKDIQSALQALAAVGCVEVYEVDGKPYLQLPTWEVHQQIRAKKSKYPAPDGICNQMISDDIKCSRNQIQSESNTESESESESESVEAADAGHRSDYMQIMTMYNEICVSYPHCSKLSDKRKKAINARLASGYTIDDFRTVFQKAEASRFLKGGNNRNWKADFDWMIADANMAKIFDGKYDDGVGTKVATSYTPPSGEKDRLLKLYDTFKKDGDVDDG